MSIVDTDRAAGSTFGALLRRHRLTAGLSQEVLAEQAQMSIDGISALERGHRQYPHRSTVALLAKALKLSPIAAAELETAAARPRQSRTVVAESTPPLAPGAAMPPNNLPLQVTSFVGREVEIAQIRALLGQHRVVTLTGSGGVGKTRTSLQVAAKAGAAVADGVWFVELGPLTSGEYVPTTIAQAVGVTLGSHGDPVDQLVAALKSKNMLLVLDNCEHLIGAATHIVAALIKACPRVTILASSRQRLGIVGEATYPMPSLPVPPMPGPARSGHVGADAALQFSAIALFVERAKAVDIRFELTDENAQSVADLCRRLDGIPFAIELAAVRVKMLSPQQLRDRLGERFRVLTGSGRDRVPRQQTLRALIDWSHDLLDEREQRLLRRLGIFASGFTLESASAVCGSEEFDAFEVFDLVASLVEKSLVMADPHGDHVRYRLLESTRVYAAEKLVAAGERDALASRHLHYFRDWFVELRREYEQLRPGIQPAFETELDELRVALDGALARSECAEGADLVAAIGGLWIVGGLGREGRALSEAFLRELPRSEHLRLGALGVSLTYILGNMGRDAEAREAGTRAVGHARASGDGPALALALECYANALLRSGDIAAAEAALSEAEAIEGVPPRRGLLLLECRAMLRMEAGDLDSAAHALARLRGEWRAADFHFNEILVTCRLADIEFRRGQYGRAAELLHEALAIARDDEASASQTPHILVFLGQVLAISGAIEEAVDPTIDAIRLEARRDPGYFHITVAIELLAYVAAAQSDLERAARLSGYAAASMARIGFSRDFSDQVVYDRLMTRLRETFAPDDLARLAARGASLTAEAAISLASTFETKAKTPRS